MRNHDEKHRDMARSVLPSTRRKGAREDRARIHRAERARLRQELHRLRSLADRDDYEGDLAYGWKARRDMADMVRDRRDGDKVGPLLNWAERVVERDPALAEASAEDREVYFRAILPPGLVGTHALTHLRWVFDDRPLWLWLRPSTATSAPTDSELVRDLVAAGLHGELNRRIKASLDRVVRVTVRLPPERLIDVDHPSPGVLLPRRTIVERRRRPLRLLAGAHDLHAFVDDASSSELRVMRDLHAERC